jgi:hypothetical protein
LSRLDENNGSLATKFISDDLREIDSAASKITVQGDRYPERVLRMSGDRPKHDDDAFGPQWGDQLPNCRQTGSNSKNGPTPERCKSSTPACVIRVI